MIIIRRHSNKIISISFVIQMFSATSIFLMNERIFFCIDTNFDLSLISRNCFQRFYSDFAIYTMTTNKRFRCNQIKTESIISN